MFYAIDQDDQLILLSFDLEYILYPSDWSEMPTFSAFHDSSVKAFGEPVAKVKNTRLHSYLLITKAEAIDLWNEQRRKVTGRANA